MSLLNRIFGNSSDSAKKNKNSSHSDNPKINEILSFNNFIDDLLSKDSYIAKSDYLKKIEATKVRLWR